MDKPEIVYCWS